MSLWAEHSAVPLRVTSRDFLQKKFFKSHEIKTTWGNSPNSESKEDRSWFAPSLSANTASALQCNHMTALHKCLDLSVLETFCDFDFAKINVKDARCMIHTHKPSIHLRGWTESSSPSLCYREETSLEYMSKTVWGRGGGGRKERRKGKRKGESFMVLMKQMEEEA